MIGKPARQLALACALAFPAHAAASAAPPYGVLLSGTVSDSNTQIAQSAGGYATCGINLQLQGAQVVTLGPALGYWQQNIANGAVLLSLPNLARSLTNAAGSATSWSYYSAGAAVLKFATPSTGTVLFFAPANWLGGGEKITFTGYGISFNAANNTLRVQFTLNFADCSLPFNAVYQG